jgi:hypothetical protein
MTESTTHEGAGRDRPHVLADVEGYATAYAMVDSSGRTLIFVDASSGSFNGPDFDGTNHDQAAHYLSHRGQRYSALLHFEEVDGRWLPRARVYNEGKDAYGPVEVDTHNARCQVKRPLSVSEIAPKTYAVKMLTQVRDSVAAWAGSPDGRLAIAEARVAHYRTTKQAAWVKVRAARERVQRGASRRHRRQPDEPLKPVEAYERLVDAEVAELGEDA